MFSVLVVFLVMVALAAAVHPDHTRGRHIVDTQSEVKPYIMLKAYSNLTPEIIDRIRSSPDGYVHVENGRHYLGNYFEPDPDSFTLKNWRVDSNDGSDALQYEPAIGDVTVLSDGIYMVYAQILYASHRGAHIIEAEDSTGRTSDLFKCITPRVSRQQQVVRSCHTSGAVSLKAGTRLSVKMGYSRTKLVLHDSGSFWGVVQLA